ncbi:hypothetical protein [Tenacibaculum xiamenense]|uniref:hypothetical protein n=1 Tax=Tenacibaculum xiamenense TaxID=1261553 RepID=UPI0038B42EFF
MLKSILKLKDVQTLSKEEQKSIEGGVYSQTWSQCRKTCPRISKCIFDNVYNLWVCQWYA